MQHGYGHHFSVGIEEEYGTIHPTTLDLTPAAPKILDSIADEDKVPGEPRAELFQSVLEIATEPSKNIPDLAKQLKHVRSHSQSLAQAHGAKLFSAGTHPFANPDQQLVTEGERYQWVLKEMGLAAQQAVIFGLHIHVGIPDAEGAIRVANGLRNHIPELIALGANSPYWNGLPTQMMSTRTMLFKNFPRTGLPPHFDSWEAYVQYLIWGKERGAFSDETYIWWDIRPHPRWGTVEVRCLDAQTNVEHSLVLAAYIQTLAHYYYHVTSAPKQNARTLSHLHWMAMRHGLDYLWNGLTIGQNILRCMPWYREHSQQLGCEDWYNLLPNIVYNNGARRQLEQKDAYGAMRMLGEFNVI